MVVIRWVVSLAVLTAGVARGVCLTQVPWDVLLQIADYADWKGRCSLSSVCHFLRQLANFFDYRRIVNPSVDLDSLDWQSGFYRFHETSELWPTVITNKNRPMAGVLFNQDHFTFMRTLPKNTPVDCSIRFRKLCPIPSTAKCNYRLRHKDWVTSTTKKRSRLETLTHLPTGLNSRDFHRFDELKFFSATIAVERNQNSFQVMTVDPNRGITRLLSPTVVALQPDFFGFQAIPIEEGNTMIDQSLMIVILSADYTNDDRSIFRLRIQTVNVMNGLIITDVLCQDPNGSDPKEKAEKDCWKALLIKDCSHLFWYDRSENGQHWLIKSNTNTGVSERMFPLLGIPDEMKINEECTHAIISSDAHESSQRLWFFYDLKSGQCISVWNCYPWMITDELFCIGRKIYSMKNPKQCLEHLPKSYGCAQDQHEMTSVLFTKKDFFTVDKVEEKVLKTTGKRKRDDDDDDDDEGEHDTPQEISQPARKPRME